MNRVRACKIAACFVLTFALGGAAGWLLKPAPPPRLTETDSRSLSAGQRVLQNLDAQLKFTPEQKKVVQPLIEEWGQKAFQMGRRPRRRQELFDQYAPRIRELLATNQLADYDRIVAQARERFSQRR